jgi:hypothetical protein
MHQFLKFVYFGITLYMFRTVFSSIIRSSRLHIQQQAYVKQLLLPAVIGNEMELVLCSLELLMIDGKTIQNMYSILQK